MFATNVVHALVLPVPTDLEAARRAMERFGEVANITPVAGGYSMFMVTYFDARAAASALKALGAAQCWPAPPMADRFVVMAGDMEIDASVCSKISGIELAPGTAGETYLLEFFDVRDAAYYRLEAVRKEELVSSTAALAATESACAAAAATAVATTASSSSSASSTSTSSALTVPKLWQQPQQQVKAPAAAKQALGRKSPQKGRLGEDTVKTEERTKQAHEAIVSRGSGCGGNGYYEEVLITGLPSTMLSDVMLEAVLEQSGLDGALMGFRTHRGRLTGDAVVILSGRRAAEKCVRHFRGCRWGTDTTPVTAQILPRADGACEEATGVAGVPSFSTDELCLIRMEAREDAERGDDRANEETFGTDFGSWSFEQQVAANAKLTEPIAIGKSAVRSDASTDVSESDDEDRAVLAVR